MFSEIKILSLGLFFNISRPSLEFVPSRRIIIGHFNFFPLVASTIPSATKSHLVIPPKIFIKTLLTFESVSNTSSAALTVSDLAPPPISKSWMHSSVFSYNIKS